MDLKIRIDDEVYSHFLNNKYSRADIIAVHAALNNAVSHEPETVTEFAERCRECGARYGKLLKQKSWIPVSEELPKKSGTYWCTFGGSNFTGSDYYTTKSEAKKLFDVDNPEEYAGWRSKNVIAWMPIPEPYKEAIK